MCVCVYTEHYFYPNKTKKWIDTKEGERWEGEESIFITTNDPVFFSSFNSAAADTFLYGLVESKFWKNYFKTKNKQKQNVFLFFRFPTSPDGTDTGQIDDNTIKHNSFQSNNIAVVFDFLKNNIVHPWPFPTHEKKPAKFQKIKIRAKN